MRAGHAPADAEKLSRRRWRDRHGESNRDRMRHIFKDVPVIYGFPDKAPLGRYAGPLLETLPARRAASSAPGGQPEAARARSRASAMTATAGMTDADPRAGFRRDVCQFSDDRLHAAQKVAFMHEVLGRDMAEVRMFLDHLERYSATLAADAARACRRPPRSTRSPRDEQRACALPRVRARCRRPRGARAHARAGAAAGAG